jgi:hypothetical protein
VIHQQLESEADIFDPLGFINEDGRGIPNDAFQMLQFVPGNERLSVEVVAVPGFPNPSRIWWVIVR